MAAFRPRWGCIDGWGSIRGGINQMATNDGFQPDRSPIFLSGHAEETEQPDIGRAWDIATISSRILKTSILAVTVTAIGIAILSIGNPVALVANVTDWWVDKPALQPEPIRRRQQFKQSPALRTCRRPQRIRRRATKLLRRLNLPIRARVEVGQSQAEASQSQAETSQPLTEELFKQFQAWAAEEETRAQAGPAQPVQAAPIRVMQDAPTRVRPVKKHRQVRSVQNARAEIRPQRNHRARVREEQDARGQVPPVADPRAQDPSMQNAQTPSLLQSLGLRN